MSSSLGTRVGSVYFKDGAYLIIIEPPIWNARVLDPRVEPYAEPEYRPLIDYIRAEFSSQLPEFKLFLETLCKLPLPKRSRDTFFYLFDQKDVIQFMPMLMGESAGWDATDPADQGLFLTGLRSKVGVDTRIVDYATYIIATLC